MNRTPASLAVMLLGAILLGTAANLLSPRRIPWTEDWTRHVERGAADAGLHVLDLTQVRRLVATGAHLILDARPPDAYNAGHLPGALSLPVDEVDVAFPPLAPALDPATPLLVYCSGRECDESLRLGEFLRDQGYTNVSIFPGGYEAWMAAPAGETP
ncbi:MAG: rhodanese-like domain-containing protein [Lentisphaerae bacterium]|nr:rhodanese-like domain-containing protein [Lentisphaerota bacterium]